MTRRLLLACLLFVGGTFATLAEAPGKTKLKPDVEKFITQMVQQHAFDRTYLQQLFGQLKSNDGVVKAINAPATAKPWYEFKGIFVTPTRTSGGVTFWNDNAEQLKRYVNLIIVRREYRFRGQHSRRLGNYFYR